MTWAYYSGWVTDYTTEPVPFTEEPDIFQRARASAIMIGMDDTSFFRLRVTGIDAKNETYGVHLHKETCDAGNPGAAGPHYNANWNPLGELSDNEVWLDLDVNSDGNARSTATVSFIPEEGTRSIVLHALETNPVTGIAGARLACLPFKINPTS